MQEIRAPAILLSGAFTEIICVNSTGNICIATAFAFVATFLAPPGNTLSARRLPLGIAEAADFQYPDAASVEPVRQDLEQWLKTRPSHDLVEGVGIDTSRYVATLIVITDGGPVSDADPTSCPSRVETDLKSSLGDPMTFKGVPVEVQSVDQIDITRASTLLEDRPW